jgi:hypothetical protein
MRIAPDESVLVLDSDTSGNWHLVRIEKWWTNTLPTDVLSVPGWNSTDAKHLEELRVDLQITPDGRYAVAFAGAQWMAKSDFLLHAPRNYVMRQPDTIATVIDLEQWKIVATTHTASIADGALRGVRVVNDKWIVLDFALGETPMKHPLYRYDTRLISIPNLVSGPKCISDRLFRAGWYPKTDDPAVVATHNDAICQNVLQATETASVHALEILIDRGQNPLPANVEQRSLDLQRTEDDFFRGWGEYPYYLLYSENPPFESSSHKWYGLYSSPERGFYDLTISDTEGREQKKRTIHELLCGDPSLEQRGSACGCRVVDASEQQHNVLAYCRTQRGDFNGMVRREWLSVLRSDDLSGAGFINLPHKERETLEQIVIGDQHPYVVTLESGELLRVYAIPDRR